MRTVTRFEIGDVIEDWPVVAAVGYTQFGQQVVLVRRDYPDPDVFGPGFGSDQSPSAPTEWSTYVVSEDGGGHKHMLGGVLYFGHHFSDRIEAFADLDRRCAEDAACSCMIPLRRKQGVAYECNFLGLPLPRQDDVLRLEQEVMGEGWWLDESEYPVWPDDVARHFGHRTWYVSEQEIEGE